MRVKHVAAAPSSAMVNGVAPPEIRHYEKIVTPVYAAELLSSDRVPNRKLNEAKIAMMADDMTAGKWRVAHHIKLDDRGRLLDGQHRMSAVIKAGVSVPMLFAEGYSPEVMEVIDTGTARTPGDLLSMLGYSDPTSRASALRILKWWEQSDEPWTFGRNPLNRLTNGEIAQAAITYPDIDVALERARRLGYGRIRGGTVFWATLLTKFGRLDANAAETFTQRLIDGVHTDENDPLHRLRDRFLVNEGSAPPSGGGRKTEEAAALTIKAWNAWRRGETIQKLRWGRVSGGSKAGKGGRPLTLQEPFPQPV